MIIDAHQHFWQPDRGDYGWLEEADPTLRRDYLPEDLLPSLARFRIERTILVQAAPTAAETEFMLGLAGRHAFIAGVVGWLDLESESFGEQLARLKVREKFVGLRPMLQDMDDDQWILRPRVLDALARMEAADIGLDILILPRHLRHVTDALAQFPRLRAVLDHMAKPAIASGEMEPWRSGVRALAAMPNIHCKVSGLVTEADHVGWTVADLAPYVEHVVASFGPDRLMWGSDWPVCRLAGEYGDVLAAAMLALPASLRGDSRIFGGNAARFYKLSGL